MNIKVDDLSDPRIAEFLEEHMRDMLSVSPPESTHALNLDELKDTAVTFWSVWQGQSLVGCAALKRLDTTHGEVKSMRVSNEFRGQGVARKMLTHLIAYAKQEGFARLSLETGSMAFFDPARRLYESFGFSYCEPFAEYTIDPNSVFMSLELEATAA
ncbi:GNAT family N-acetyltransferase [Congregibacter brevis]|uniref:GNAT family N-acetyltransferase n=1 Tax=Congregibacter brevis TaxID=3081201 RepID=A0ABZ0I7I2_9GAMM|nr:GNAT family N-acetyltransferase [Congregibacter sp. IMCC45268]